MTKGYAYIAIAAAMLILFFLVVMIVRYRRSGELPETDYRTLFILGIVWVPLGLATDNPGFWGMGVALILIGLANRDKWPKSAD